MLVNQCKCMGILGNDLIRIIVYDCALRLGERQHCWNFKFQNICRDVRFPITELLENSFRSSFHLVYERAILMTDLNKKVRNHRIFLLKHSQLYIE